MPCIDESLNFMAPFVYTWTK